MATYRGDTFVNQDVILCNNAYENCVMKDCRLVFDASGPISLVGCTFDHSDWYFDGAAADTIKFLSHVGAMAGDGSGQEFIDKLMRDIKNGSLIKK